jgi:hypothetical protein
MAKIKYQVLESNIGGVHSTFAKAIATGALTFDEMCEKACEDSSVEPEIMKAAVARYMKKAQEFLVLGYRIPLGIDFITLRPVLQCSVKDVLNDDGTVKTAATADMVRANNGVSKVGATVSPKFSKIFELKTKWQKVTATGAAVDDDEEDATLTEEETAANGGTQAPANGGGTTQNGGSSSQQNGGGSSSQSGTQQQGQEGDYRLVIYKYGSGEMHVTDDSENEIQTNSNIHSGTNINVSVVSGNGQTPTVKVAGSPIALTENDGTYVGSFVMPTKGTVIEINSEPDEFDQN